MLKDTVIYGDLRDALKSSFEEVLAVFPEGGEVSFHEESGESREGYASLTDGSMGFSTLLPLDSETLFNFEQKLGVSREAADALSFACASDLAARISDACRHEGIPDQDIDLIEKGKFLENPSAFHDKANSLIEKLDEAGADTDFESDFCELRLEAILDISEAEPFYCHWSLNLDSPYFRSNAQRQRDMGNSGGNLDLLLAEKAGLIPENAEELNDFLAALDKKAFPDLDADASRPKM